jgi:putative oxygen-independent coproporphyrinogen III oxidase
VSLSVARARSGEWVADPGFGVYVHIPFCKHRCHYCDFNTYEGQDSLHGPYVDALVADIDRYTGPAHMATSVFFGGGTPTLLEPEDLGRILGAVERSIGLAPGAEITVEANPETVNEAKFSSLLETGFNRFSVGIQSLVPHVLDGLGRRHSTRRALEALDAARRAGVEDLNADLIYGSPWETPADWTASLDGLVDAPVDHVSAYALTVEEGTPLATLVATGRVPNVDPDEQAERHNKADEALSAAGFERYEISNWARPGRASRHNVLYWCAGDYLGFGAGAHQHLSGRRSWNVRLPRDFIARVEEGRLTEEGHESLDDDRRAGEALMLGLRLVSGIDWSAFARRFGAESLEKRTAAVAELGDRGLVAGDDGRLRLTSRGTLLANEVLMVLL